MNKNLIIVFGYWHGVSMSMSLGFSLLGTYAINYYSTRMIEDIYVLKDGDWIEVKFHNAFWVRIKFIHYNTSFSFLRHKS